MNCVAYVMDEIQGQPGKSVIDAEHVYHNISCPLSKRSYYEILNQMVQKGALIRLDDGLYCHARRSCTGALLPLSNQEIVSYYTAENRGVCIGYVLYRAKGLTTQVSKRTEVLSVAINEECRHIRGVSVERLAGELTPEIVRGIEVLEILEHCRQMEDFNHSAFLRYMDDFARSYSEVDVLRVLTMRPYEKFTIALLKQYLDKLSIPNSLGNLLSSNEIG